LRIGAERSIVGHLRGGFGTWADGGGPLESTGRINVDELADKLDHVASADAPLVIDVRQANEYEAYHVPGSINIAAGSLPDRLAELPHDHPIVTICAAGLRAGLAASILRSSGFEDVAWVASGVPAWRAAGHPVVRGDQPTRAPGRPSGAASRAGAAEKNRPPVAAER
jgi:hydroxyacylglutathione hydrolase